MSAGIETLATSLVNQVTVGKSVHNLSMLSGNVKMFRSLYSLSPSERDGDRREARKSLFGFVTVPQIGDVFIHIAGGRKWGFDGSDYPALIPLENDETPLKGTPLYLDEIYSTKGPNGEDRLRCSTWVIASQTRFAEALAAIAERPVYYMYDSSSGEKSLIWEGVDLKKLRYEFPKVGKLVSFAGDCYSFEVETANGPVECEDPR